LEEVLNQEGEQSKRRYCKRRESMEEEAKSLHAIPFIRREKKM